MRNLHSRLHRRLEGAARTEPNPTEHEIRFWLANNLCRCTGYDKIVLAVQTRPENARGLDMTTTEYERNVVLSTKEYDVVWTRPVRHDGADKVTGRALYGADFAAAGLLHGKILRSPHAHARILSIDTGRAEALPGVQAVVTAADFPATPTETPRPSTSGTRPRERECPLRGHAIAGVAATSPHVAEEALALIDVRYEVLPAVLTAPEGMKDDAPLLHDDLRPRSSASRPTG